MILGDHIRDPATFDGPTSLVTLDELFRRACERRPDALALVDPPDRATFTDGAPRRLTYAEADRAIRAIAARLGGLGLPTDAIVALQLPNTVEGVLALLGVLRAGMIAAPLPLLWRQADAASVLSRLGARALITCRQVGQVDHAELAMHVAAETFTIRFVGAFGSNLPDGVMPLDDVLEESAYPVHVERAGAPAHHVAVVTSDVTPGGLVPVARSHAELIAGGLAVQLEARIGADEVILGAVATASFAGLASTIMPWLLTGGTLSLHHPFAPTAFATQRAGDRCSYAVVPGALALRLLDAGLVGGRYGLKAILAVWRTPERLAGSAMWPGGGTALIDIPVFGELGLVAARRTAGGAPVGIPLGRVVAPRGATNGASLVTVARTPTGTVALSGPMVPRFPFPPGAERGEAPRLKLADDGSVDTLYPCRVDRDTRMLVVDGPPAGIVNVGGYRFVLRELQDMVGRVAEGGTLAALPDMLAGHRLAGAGSDRNAIRETLMAQGVNPLVVEAFRPRRPGEKASAA